MKRLHAMNLLCVSLLVFAAGGPGVAGAWAGEADLRPAFERWGLDTPVQGGRGTCSVFTVAGALEYALARQLGTGTRLSAEYLNWASNEAVGVDQDGGFFADLWKGFEAYGVCPAEDMPYAGAFDPDRVPSAEARERARRLKEGGFDVHWIKRWDIRTGLGAEQLAAIKETLDAGWPVCGGFRWPTKPFAWTGRGDETPPPGGVFDGHSVLLVGYRDDPEQAGGGAFTFRNTADGRHGLMTYEYARVYTNDAMWVAAVEGRNAAARRVELASLDLTKMAVGWGAAKANRNIVDKTMAVAGRTFETGVGSHADSVLHVKMDGRVERFTAKVGVDDETQGRGSVVFQVFGDGRKLFDSGVMRGGAAAKVVDVSLDGVEHLILVATGAGDGVSYDHADWGEAGFEVRGGDPEAILPPHVNEEKVILTPRAGPEPRINAPGVFGGRPGRPFVYRIPCTGERPMTFAAAGLPGGLELDAETGIITGTLPEERGRFEVTLTASNARGRAEKPFAIVVGDTLALTPPMGWNSWYIHYHRVTEEHMRQAADAMVDSGMADYGYMYVNIDDCWMKKQGDEPYRGADGAVLTNDKFPDIGGMCDYVHGKGLRAGVYTSPGAWTCAGYVGSYEHEEADLRRFVEWGFDFLKYDWCSYGRVFDERRKEARDLLAEYQRPYRLMGGLLEEAERDIVFNLCQYGMADVWTWGGEVGGHCWRTTGDLGLERASVLPGFYSIGFSNMRHAEYARPGRWNDPDYLLIGWVGDAHSTGEGRPTTLTGNEQYSYMSMWCLMAAPLIFSGDMAKLDAFTLNVLCNAEVIEVDQDVLGRQADVVEKSDETLILRKPMADGSIAVGLFNLTEVEREVGVTWEPLGLDGAQRVRDLWRQRDLADARGRFTARVPRHGVALVRMWGR